jgi:glycosyltransferase involved in cell wall biosynthesis
MYNEEGNIRTVVSAAISVLAKVCDEFEVIIVNDGSQDQTRQIAEELARQDKRIRVINHANNQGYGAALRSGFAACKYEIIFQTDGDDQFYLEEIDKLLPFIKDHDFVIGYRVKRHDPLTRTFIALFYRAWLRLVFGLKFRDINCAFKLLRKNIIDRLDLRSNGGVINGEIFAKARQLGYDRVKEVGVRHRARPSGKQTGASPRVLGEALASILGLRKIIRGFQKD